MRVWVREGSTIGPDFACLWVELDDDRMLVVAEDGSWKILHDISSFNLPGIEQHSDPILAKFDLTPRADIVLLEVDE